MTVKWHALKCQELERDTLVMLTKLPYATVSYIDSLWVMLTLVMTVMLRKESSGAFLSLPQSLPCHIRPRNPT